jgi:hypothetical protein
MFVFSPANAANAAGFHGTRGRRFALKCSFILGFKKRFPDTVIDKVPGK